MTVALKSRKSLRTAVLAQDLRAVFGKIRRKLREQSVAGDLTPSQVSVLLRLEKDGPATASAWRGPKGCGRNPSCPSSRPWKMPAWWPARPIPATGGRPSCR